MANVRDAHNREANERTHGIRRPFAAFAEASAPVAIASADSSELGAQASAHATLGSVRAGFEGTPLQASASGPSVGASAGAHLNLIGASVSAHAGEVTAGPFAVRVGVKVGAGIENGVPVLHAGPVSTPCCIM